MTTLLPDMDLVSARLRLLEIVRKKAYKEGKFTLASGKTSDFYLDCRLVTLDPEGLALFSRLVCAELGDAKAVAVGGLTLGADPIAAGVALMSHLLGRPLRAFIVRKEQKQHGTAKEIEGELGAGDRAAIVDDVMTSGGSVKLAIAAVERAGAKVAKVVCLVDRQEGGSDELRSKGYDFKALYTLKDIRGK